MATARLFGRPSLLLSALQCLAQREREILWVRRAAPREREKENSVGVVLSSILELPLQHWKGFEVPVAVTQRLKPGKPAAPSLRIRWFPLSVVSVSSGFNDHYLRVHAK